MLKKKIRWQIHIRSLLTNKPQRVGREWSTITVVLKAILTKQWILTPSLKDWVCFWKARPSSQTVWAAPLLPPTTPHPATFPLLPLSVSFLVTELTRQRHWGLCPGLTCSLFQFCSRIPAEPIYMAGCPPTDSCIQLQKRRLVKLVFWLLFKAIVPVKPRGPSGMRSFGVDEWASRSEQARPRLSGNPPGEGKGFGYLRFPPDRYVNYFLPRRFLKSIITNNS